MLIYILHNEEVYEVEADELSNGSFRPTQYDCLTYKGGKLPRNDIVPKDSHTVEHAFYLYKAILSTRINTMKRDILALESLISTASRLAEQYTRTDIWEQND